MNNNITTTLQAKPEGKNPSMQEQVIAENQDSLMQTLSSEKGNETIENDLDLAELNSRNPDFKKYNFNADDMEYLENVKNDFLKDSSFKNLQKVIGEIPLDRTDWAEAIVIIRNKVLGAY